jgi:ubiquinone/menaquinone biosynthesis C-methylase UbiE
MAARSATSRLLGAFLRFFFEHLYTTLAWAYDFVAWASSAGQWDAWRATALEWIPERGRLLELGPGTGHLLAALQSRGRSAVALERSAQMVGIVRRRWTKTGGPAPIARGLAQAQPFASGSFDAVVSTFPSEYILEADSLSEIHRTLLPGGRLVVVTAAWPTGSRGHDRLAGWLYRFTGQALDPDGPWTRALRDSIIPLKVETVARPRGVVIVLHGEKPL